MTVALIVLLAALAVIVLPLVINGGPACECCGWTHNQCEESWHFAKRACCERCTHPREVVDRNQ